MDYTLMDNLLKEMIEAGKAEIQQVPTLKGALGRFLWSFTEPFDKNHEALKDFWDYATRLSRVDNHVAGKGVLSFPLFLYNGVKISNENGGLN